MCKSDKLKEQNTGNTERKEGVKPCCENCKRRKELGLKSCSDKKERN